MKRKPIFIGGAIILCAAIAIFFLAKSRSSQSDSDDETSPENVPSVVPVQTAALKRMTLHSYINGFGTIEPAPATADESAADATLAAPVAGVIAKINVVVGEHIEKGDVLMELNSGAMSFNYVQQEVERQKKLFAEQNTSLKNLQDAEAQLASLQIVSPLAGTVTRVTVKLGQAIDVSAVVAEVMDLNRLAVSAQIPATDAGELKVGAEVQINGTGFQTAASLSFVSPAVDANDGAIFVWAKLPVENGLRPGQFVQIKIVTAVHTNCLAAPEESIVTDEKGQSVIALVNGDEATQTPVKIGLRENNWVEIEGTNLQANDSVVTVGAYGLPEKTKIKIVNSSEANPDSAPAQ